MRPCRVSGATLIAGNAGHRASVRGCAHPARWWSFPNKATCMPVHAAAQTCPKRNGRGLLSVTTRGWSAPTPAGRQRRPIPERTTWPADGIRPWKRRQGVRKRMKKQSEVKKRGAACVLDPQQSKAGPSAPTAASNCPIPPGVNMSKCPLCGGALPDLNDPPAPGAPGAPRAAAPQAPGSPGAPAAPKAPSAPEPPTA